MPLDKYMKVERIPVVVHNDTYSSYTYTDEGLLDKPVTEDEATHFLYHTFHIVEKENENG